MVRFTWANDACGSSDGRVLLSPMVRVLLDPAFPLAPVLLLPLVQAVRASPASDTRLTAASSDFRLCIVSSP